MKTLTNILIGADPEFFLFSKKHQTHVSAWGLFPGTKSDPYPLEGGAMQVDGTALEFNINPTDDPQKFDKIITLVLKQMQDIINKVDNDLSMDFTPLTNFGRDYWKTIPIGAKHLGCEADFNSFGMRNPSPNPNRIRTAAGHIHLGFTKGQRTERGSDHFDKCVELSRHFHELKSLEINPLTNLEKQRLDFYGGNGSFRPKSYGLELRSPSNLWVKDTNSRTKIFNNAQNSFRKAQENAELH